MNYRPPKGSKWEQLAESFLNGRGLRTLERNFHCRMGEIDLVMLDGQTLVFTEVRYRANDRHGSGAESVTFAKQRRIINTAQNFLRFREHHPSQTCRFDVVSIGNEEGRPLINWIRNAFDAS
jgi:putative endonuclease